MASNPQYAAVGWSQTPAAEALTAVCLFLYPITLSPTHMIGLPNFSFVFSV